MRAPARRSNRNRDEPRVRRRRGHRQCRPRFDQATISADGTRVAFESSATNLTATPDTNGMLDVYVRDLTTGVTTLAATTNNEVTDVVTP